MDLYSRQIGAFGLEAMLKLVKMKVLIIGVKGVGIECAKNTTLAGVHTMGLYDPAETELKDLGSNFFLTADDIGTPRARACVPKVSELNGSVRVKEVPELTEAVVAEYSAVVFTKGTQAEAIKWNEFCRSQPVPIYFLSCFTGGAVTSIFVDCGPKHIIKDRDGRNPIQKIVQGFETKEDENGKLYYLIRYITPEGQPPENFPDDGLVEFSDVGGLTFPGIEIEGAALSLNNIHKVCTLRSYHHWKDPVGTIRLCMPDKDADGNNVYIHGLTDFDPGTSAGYMSEKKEPKEVSFDSLAERIKAPGEVVMAGDLNDSGLLMFDMTFSMVEKQIHVAVQGVKEWQAQNGGALPPPNDAAVANKVLELAKAFNDANKIVEEVDDAVIKKIAVHSGVELQPMCAFVGGIVAQELVKISGKFTPIMQFLNYHAFEALPDTVPEDTAPMNTRYDDQIAIYGRKFQEMLGDLKIFMVGCGALGCEFVKNVRIQAIPTSA